MDPTTSLNLIGSALIPRNIVSPSNQNELIIAQIFNSRLEEAIKEREAIFNKVFESKEKIIKNLLQEIEVLQLHIEIVNTNITTERYKYEIEKIKLDSKITELENVILRLNIEVKIKELFQQFFEKIVSYSHQYEKCKDWREKDKLGQKLCNFIHSLTIISEMEAIGDPETNPIWRFMGWGYAKELLEKVEENDGQLIASHLMKVNNQPLYKNPD